MLDEYPAIRAVVHSLQHGSRARRHIWAPKLALLLAQDDQSIYLADGSGEIAYWRPTADDLLADDWEIV